MPRRLLLWWIALALVMVAAPTQAQSVRTFDDPGTRTAPEGPSSGQYPPPSSSGTAPRQVPAYPTAPTTPVVVPSQPNYQQGYPQGYQQPGMPTSTYVLAPPVLPYRKGMEAPEGYVLEKHRNRGLMVGGGLTWGGAYAVGLVYGLTKGFDNGTGWLAVPLVGPWGAIKGRSFECKGGNNISQKEVDACVDGALNEVTAITFLAVTGLVQAVGATLVFVGVGDVSREWVRKDLANVEFEADAGPVGDGYGFKLSGRF